MFSEVLRIKPVLDSSTAKQMETNLATRFGRIAQRFGGGLKAVIKGSILGISIGLLNRLLNPLEALEDRIKNLVGQGSDIRDLADRFGTSAGTLKQIQDFGKSVGVDPDKLKDLMQKFAQAVETAREEIQDPTKVLSPSSIAVRQFTSEKDLGKGFLDFLLSLRREGQTSGRDIFFSDYEKQAAAQRAAQGKVLSDDERQLLASRGLIRHQTGQESRQEIERTVFGEQLFGSQKRLVETDFNSQLGKLNEPSLQSLNSNINKLAGLSDQKNFLEVQSENKVLAETAKTLNAQMIADMEAAKQREEKRTTDQLKSYEDLRRGADAVEDLKEGMANLLSNVSSLLGELKNLTSFIPKITSQRWWNNIMQKGGF